MRDNGMFFGSCGDFWALVDHFVQRIIPELSPKEKLRHEVKNDGWRPENGSSRKERKWI